MISGRSRRNMALLTRHPPFSTASAPICARGSQKDTSSHLTSLSPRTKQCGGSSRSQFARAIYNRGARAAFSAFLESPREDQFVRFEDAQPQQPSVEAFICEVLRLHPPSGRLARAAPSRVGVFHFPLWAPVTTHVTNIEVLHQDTAIWGSDAGVFDPVRFHGF
ncbi:hypothetical protein EDB87DRAFT_166743 [Lactarius vividus]|nr:hypothetical protein EDB87DRAFT_166743 [Lactarius vividus]